MTRIKSIFVNLLVLLVTLLIMLVLLEVALRVLNLAPGNSLPTVNQKEFESVPGIFKPNESLTDMRHVELPFQVDVNSFGYRGENFPLQKPADETRILVVGDSYTFGDYVNNDETLPAQLEQQLAVLNPNRQIRVINAGLSGSTVVGQRQMIERALPLEPDLVLLVNFSNDVEDMNNPMWYSLAQNRELKGRFPVSVLYAVFGKTATWNLLLKFKFLLSRERITQTGEVDTAAEEARKAALRSQLQDKYQDEMENLHGFINEQEIKFVVAIFPSHHSMRDETLRNPVTWAREMLSAADIDNIDLLPTFLASGNSVEDLHLLPIDGHPNPLGYEIAAKELASELSSRLGD